MGRMMMANRRMVVEYNNKCPFCGKKLSDDSLNWVVHRPYNCDKNPDVILKKKEEERLKKNGLS